MGARQPAKRKSLCGTSLPTWKRNQSIGAIIKPRVMRLSVIPCILGHLSHSGWGRRLGAGWVIAQIGHHRQRLLAIPATAISMRAEEGAHQGPAGTFEPKPTLLKLPVLLKP